MTPIVPACRHALVAGLLAVLLAPMAWAQERFSLFVPSAQPTVERLVKLARIQDSDVVVDLGSGDGRIVLTAARDHPKIRGWGVDINEKLVRQSNEEAARQGVADRVRFYHRNVFDADLSQVTVINMWLFPELMRLLRPKIMAEARPGTRVLTHLFDMGAWPADEWDKEGGSAVGLWIVPARVEGYWSWQLPLGGSTYTYDFVLQQQFQVVEGTGRVGNRRESLSEARLRGTELSFVFDMTVTGFGRAKHEFQGRVAGDRIEGRVIVSPAEGKPFELPWTATRTATSGWFRPTGLDLK